MALARSPVMAMQAMQEKAAMVSGGDGVSEPQAIDGGELAIIAETGQAGEKLEKQMQETEGVARMELRSWGRWKRAASCLLRHYFAKVRPLTDDGLPLSLAGSEVIAVGEGADDDIEGTVSLEAAGWSQVRRPHMGTSSCSSLGSSSLTTLTATTGHSDGVHGRSNEAAGDGDQRTACMVSESDSG
jgi:hypothetical protein